jgi:protein TonB
MRRLFLICTAWFAALLLAQGAHAKGSALSLAGAVTPSQRLAESPPLGKARDPRPQRSSRNRLVNRPAQVAALDSPDLGLYPSMMQTEEEALTALERELSLKVGKQIRAGDYPDEAIRFRWTGTTLIQVQVAGDGTVMEVSLERSSGFSVLDEQALVVVRRVSKVFLPFRLRGREHSVTVPVGFYLKDV